MKAVTFITSGKRDAAFIIHPFNLYAIRIQMGKGEKSFTDIYESDRLAQGFYESNRLYRKHL